VWGGRGKGGRGIQRNTVQPKDVHIEGFTLAFQGQTLLDRTVLKLANEHRYGLIGSNGVGKTTLLRRIATGSVPGWPQHMSSYLVQQEGVVRDDGTAASVLDTVLQSDITRNSLLEEEAFLMEVSLLQL
jgi:ATP-binding cassette, subfamily F, member 3